MLPTLPTLERDDGGGWRAAAVCRNKGVYVGEGRHCTSGQPLHTYHFIIDFMEMNLTDFLHNVFILKSDKAKP